MSMSRYIRLGVYFVICLGSCLLAKPTNSTASWNADGIWVGLCDCANVSEKCCLYGTFTDCEANQMWKCQNNVGPAGDGLLCNQGDYADDVCNCRTCQNKTGTYEGMTCVGYTFSKQIWRCAATGNKVNCADIGPNSWKCTYSRDETLAQILCRCGTGSTLCDNQPDPQSAKCL